MVYTDLHVIVPHAVHQQPLQVEQISAVGHLQQPVELEAGVTLRHLTYETNERHVSQRVHVLGQRACNGQNDISLVNSSFFYSGHTSRYLENFEGYLSVFTY